jgi:hypothetical protein
LDQVQLPGMPGRPARRQDDYHGLFPNKVHPTGGIDVLERGGNLLFIKSYGPDATITPAQNRIWQLLTSISNVTDAPGNITVACVWGLAAQMRTVYIYDYRGDGPTKIWHKDEWRLWLHDWWEEAKR